MPAITASGTTRDKQNKSYVDSPQRGSDFTAQEVFVGNPQDIIGKFTPPTESDTVTVTYPSSTVEVYSYRQGGLTGTILKTITVTYTTASKQLLQSVVVT